MDCIIFGRDNMFDCGLKMAHQYLYKISVVEAVTYIVFASNVSSVIYYSLMRDWALK